MRVRHAPRAEHADEADRVAGTPIRREDQGDLVHLGRYALGGFGLVFVEATAVEEVGLINENDLGIWNEAQAASNR